MSQAYVLKWIVIEVKSKDRVSFPVWKYSVWLKVAELICSWLFEQHNYTMDLSHRRAVRLQHSGNSGNKRHEEMSSRSI